MYDFAYIIVSAIVFFVYIKKKDNALIPWIFMFLLLFLGKINISQNEFINSIYHYITFMANFSLIYFIYIKILEEKRHKYYLTIFFNILFFTVTVSYIIKLNLNKIFIIIPLFLLTFIFCKLFKNNKKGIINIE